MADEEAHGESIIPCDKRNLAPKVGPKFMMKARNLRPLVTAIQDIAPKAAVSLIVESEHVFEHSLLWDPHPSAIENYGCCNESNVDRLSYQIKPRSSLRLCSSREFLAEYALHCWQCQVKRCANPECVAVYMHMATSAPPSQWVHLRDWVITVMSCRSSTNAPLDFQQDRDDGLGEFMRRQPLRLASQPMWWLQGAIAAGEHPPHLSACGEGDVFSILQLVRWMSGDIYDSQQYSWYFEQTWMHGALETALRERGWFWPKVSDAIAVLPSCRVCQKRVWDLAQSDPAQEHTLPSIVHLARHSTLDPSFRHVKCTPEICFLTEDNNTQKVQLHKCKVPEACTTISLNTTRLDTVYNESTRDEIHSWSLNGHKLMTERSYMALSHVWSDGTGVGLRVPGNVNTCLFDFFARLAEQEGCEGIWWDAISLPTSRSAKRRALNMMPTIYNRAKFVLVHDSALADTVWKDDGSSCLALVLSDWFTRAWTALELWAGQTVKVLFRTSDGTPLLKDLYKDILTPSESQGGHLAYRMATTLLGHVRKTNPLCVARTGSLDVSQLLHVLLPRAASFPRDKMIVAGLMAGVRDIDPQTTPSELTKDILLTQGTVESALLYHSRAPMSQQGPWSWCPPTLLNLEPAPFRDVRFKFRVRPDGAIIGELHPVLLTAEIARTLLPASTHLTGRMRVAEALRNWDHCLLLQEEGEHPRIDKEGRFLLVVAHDLAVKGSVIGSVRSLILVVLDCHYIGTVTGRVAGAKPMGQISVRLGSSVHGCAVRCLPEMMKQLQYQSTWYWDAMELEQGKSWWKHIKQNKPFWKGLIERNDFVTWGGYNDVADEEN